MVMFPFWLLVCSLCSHFQPALPTSFRSSLTDSRLFAAKKAGVLQAGVCTELVRVLNTFRPGISQRKDFTEQCVCSFQN